MATFFFHKPLLTLNRLLVLITALAIGIKTSCAATDFNFTPNLQKAYSEAQKLRIQSSQQLLAKESNSNGLKLYVDDYTEIVTLLITENPALFERWKANEEKRLDALAKMDDKSPYQRFLQAEIRLHWAFVKLKFGKEISACWDIIKADRLLEANAKLFPDFVANQKSLGLLHVLIGSTPENYAWVARMIGLEGDIKKGLAELQNVIQKDSIFRTEAQLIDVLVHAYILTYSDKKNAEVVEFVRAHPDNLLLYFFGTTVSLKDGRGAQALAFLQNKPTGAAYLSMPFWDYLKAEILLQKGGYDAAKIHYLAFLSQHAGVNFIKDTYFKLFLCSWLVNSDAEARPYLEKIRTLGSTNVESDKAALKFAGRFLANQVPVSQKILLQARFACDGGFTDAAQLALKNYSENSFKSITEKAEFQYRTGRIYQRNQQPDRAIAPFDRAIVLCENTNLSFGATSALQLGYVYKLRNQRDKARFYFQKALSWPKHEYKNSVDNKARAALSTEF